MGRFFLIVIILCCSASYVFSQQSNAIKAEVEGQVGFTSSGTVPFWLRSNQYGSVPVEGGSFSAVARVKKEYSSDTLKRKTFDWGFGMEGRANIGQESNLLLIEGYAKAKVAMFQLKAGRSRDMQGLIDTTLSTGSFIQSGTALGIPKIELSIPEFYRLPILDGILSVKGNFAHGWLGKVPIYNNEHFNERSYFHQKSLWGRIGKSDWKTRVYAGFSHNVVWGNERNWIGYFPFNDFETYKYVIFGKVFNDSKVGNHGGTIDLRVEHDFQQVSLAAYRQNFYDVGALYHLANVRDGLQGITLTNRQQRSSKVYWKKFLIEYLYTKNQAGEEWSKPTPTGNENYMNHYLYPQGWSYKQIGMGTPFISRLQDVNKHLPYKTEGRPEYFSNNRVQVWHLGAVMAVYDWDLTAKVSYSKNYGTHTTRDDFPVTSQFSAYLEAMRTINAQTRIGAVGAFDQGNLLQNSSGVFVKLVRQL